MLSSESSQFVHIISSSKQLDGKEIRIEKSRVISNITDIAYKTSNCGDTNSRWYFADECPQWASYSTSVDKMSIFLTGISSLSNEGFYCNVVNKWRRKYLSREGVVIILVEDVPAEGGQNCLWAAGLVMSRYLEHPRCDIHIRGKRVLELGAGAGLTSMVMSLLGGNVFCTEQESCLPYLKSNLLENPSIDVTVRELQWAIHLGEDEDTFSVIIGCDITYDIRNLGPIFLTIQKCLNRNGVAVLCHDNESCPLASRIYTHLVQAATTAGMRIEDISYGEFVDSAYVRDSVKMWKICFIN